MSESETSSGRLPRIDFRIGARVQPDCDEVPSDPLDELSPIDMSIRLFSHFENHAVFMAIYNLDISIDCKPARFTFELDLSADFLNWIESYRKLMRRQSTTISFPERWWMIKCIPDSKLDRITLMFETFGHSISAKEFTCDQKQFCAALCQFLQTVARLAHETGYLNDAQLNEILAEIS